MDQLALFVSAFIYIFVIMDPFASLPLFILLTKKFSKKETRRAAKDAILVAGALAFLFIFAGEAVLSAIRIDLNSFKIAGGVVLGLLGIETIFGMDIFKNSKMHKHAVTTLIGTPMLTGPGLITALVIMSGEQGTVIPLVATLAALLISWVVLDNAAKVREKLGSEAIEVVAKVFGLFLVAIGVSLIRGGLGA